LPGSGCPCEVWHGGAQLRAHMRARTADEADANGAAVLVSRWLGGKRLASSIAACSGSTRCSGSTSSQGEEMTEIGGKELTDGALSRCRRWLPHGGRRVSTRGVHQGRGDCHGVLVRSGVAWNSLRRVHAGWWQRGMPAGALRRQRRTSDNRAKGVWRASVVARVA
jgi:hypothetical protein